MICRMGFQFGTRRAARDAHGDSSDNWSSQVMRGGLHLAAQDDQLLAQESILGEQF